MFEQKDFPVMFSCVRMGRLTPIHGVDGIEVVAQAVSVLKVGESVPTVWVRPALPGACWGEWVAQSAQPVDAWMTEDGRIATDETKRTGMAGPSRVNFNIPLTRLSTKLLRAEGVQAGDERAKFETDYLERHGPLACFVLHDDGDYWDPKTRACWASWRSRAALASAPVADMRSLLSDSDIREIFLAHGFTIKNGQTDLKPYVYEAARALISVARIAADADKALEIYAARESAPVADAVAYLDLGAGGYMDVGTDLTDEQLAAIPKGRHMLAIIGTHGVAGYTRAARASEAVDLSAVSDTALEDELRKRANRKSEN